MRLTVNGSEEETAAATVAELVAARGLAAEQVAVEHNGVILPRGEWPATRLAAGDRLELVAFVGGGSGGRQWTIS